MNMPRTVKMRLSRIIIFCCPAATFIILAGCKKSFSNKHELEFHEVDLGLSVKWANMNLGASTPDDYGDYFAWGEIKPKDEYTEDNYEFCMGAISSLTKYSTRIDNKTTLDLSDDAAFMNLEGHWRMPTREEWSELQTNCKWTWRQTINGHQGFEVRGKNGNSIFLPAAGFYTGKKQMEIGEEGRYWSSTILNRYPGHAYVLLFYSNPKGDGVHKESNFLRCNGYTVRAVCP